MAKMISKFRSHYPLVDLWLAISLFITFWAVIGSVSIESNIMQAEIEAEQYSLKNGGSITFQEATYSDIRPLMKGVGEIARLDDITLLCNTALTSVLADIFMYGDVETWYPLTEGRYPTAEELENHERVILLGKKRAEIAYEREGKLYITIESEEYLVTGIIGTEQSNYLAYKTVLFEESLGENVRTKLSSLTGYTVYLESQELTARDLYQVIWRLMDENQLSRQIYVQDKTVGDYHEKNRREEEIPALLLFAFCLVEAVLVSEMWIYQRLPEMVIRKTFGYSNKQLALYLIKEIARYLVLAVILTLIGIVYMNRIGWTSMNISLIFVGMVCGMAVIVGGIVIGYPLYYVSHLSEWQLMKKIG